MCVLKELSRDAQRDGGRIPIRMPAERAYFRERQPTLQSTHRRGDFSVPKLDS
jgi:hypothetical protein